MDPAFGHWFSGFVAGEGSFTVRLPKPRASSPRHLEVDVEFSIVLRDDDAPILYEIRRRLRVVGQIKYIGALTNRQGVRSNPRVTLSVRRVKNCLRLVEILDQYPLRARKRRDYAIWRAIVLALASLPRGNRWHGPTDRTKVVRMVHNLRKVRKYAS